MAINTISKVNKLVSEKLNIPEFIVAEINKRYWEDIRIELVNLNHVNINIPKLCTFSIGKLRIEKNIKKKINQIRYIRNNKNKYKKSEEELNAENILVLRKLLRLRKIKMNYTKDYLEYKFTKNEKPDKLDI